MAVYTYSKARQNLASLLDQAVKDKESQLALWRKVSPVSFAESRLNI